MLAVQVKLAHPIIGILVVALMFVQPLLGLAHHYIYLRSQRRTIWAHAHTWFGRGLIMLGIINGGLGMKLANNTTKGEIAYGVIAGVVLILYVGVNLYGDYTNGRSGKDADMSANVVDKATSSAVGSGSQGQGQIA